MKIQFDAQQQCQLDAVAAVTDLFDGHPNRSLWRWSTFLDSECLLRLSRPQLDYLAVHGEPAVSLTMNGLRISLPRIDPGFEHFKNDDVLLVDDTQTGPLETPHWTISRGRCEPDCPKANGLALGALLFAVHDDSNVISTSFKSNWRNINSRGTTMDISLSHAILAALSAGALDGAKDATKKAVADGYAALRDAITKKYKHHGDVTEALEKLEQKPQSKGHAQVLEEELNSSGASTDQALVQQAAQLMTLIKSMPSIGSGTQIAHGSGIAQADRQSTASINITYQTK
jgi:hypothetical protein